MKERDTTTLTVRLPKELVPVIDEKVLTSKNARTVNGRPSRNAWFNWLIKEGLRKHSKDGGATT